MEIQYLVKCPHCGAELNMTLEQGGGEVTCEQCNEKFWIAETKGDIVHTHKTKESVDGFTNLLAKDPDPFAKSDCPHCGKKLEVRNYFRKIGRVVDNHCMKVVYLVVDFNNDIKVYPFIPKETTIFDPDFGKTEAEEEQKAG